MIKNYAIICGGSGGHISPGIAIAEALIDQGQKCILVVSKKNIDNKMLKKYSYLQYITIPAQPFSKKPIKFINFVLSQIKSLWVSIKFLRKNCIDCIIGFGGYTNVPIVLVAFFLKKKIILHESNKVIGKSIRCLSLLANRIYLPENIQFGINFLDRKVRHFGFPLRKEIFPINKIEARKILGLDPEKRIILVMGGSQGAKILTKWALDNYKFLNENKIFVYCLTGQCCIHDKSDVNNVFQEFSDQMNLLYNAADLIVSRAGAGTIAEAMYCQCPMILIPYKYAAGDHQTKNAQYAEKLNCAFCLSLPENEILKLTSIVIQIFDNYAFKHADDKICINNTVEIIVNDIRK